MILKMLFLLLLCQTGPPSGASSDPNTILRKIDHTSTLQHATWGAYAEYVDNEKVLMDWNGERGLAPASGLKTVTTAAALNDLGPDFRFKTRLYYSGSLSKDGVLHGNIYIRGGGDPTLGSDEVSGSPPLDTLMKHWVQAIRNAGIHKIDGTIIADHHFFSGNSVPDRWLWMDIGNYYGAGANGLSIHNDQYTLWFRPGAEPGDPAEVLRMDPVIPGLTFKNHMLTGARGSGDHGYIYAAPLQFAAVLRGTVPAGYREFSIKGSIPNPPLFTAQTLHSALENAGITVTGQDSTAENTADYTSMTLITATISPPLRDIIYMTNKRSINLYAEHLLRMLGLHKLNEGTEEAGIKALYEFLEDEDIFSEGMHLYDGCGMSPSDRITPRTMTEMLAFASRQPWFGDYYRSLAIAGDPDDIGYLNNFGKNTLIANNARIKSGLIANVRSMSGYLRDRKGRLIVFSLIANNYSGSMHDVDRLYEKVLIELAGLD